VQQHQAVVAGDINGDGKADLVIASMASASLTVFLGRGDGTFSDAITMSTSPLPSAAALGDFTGDKRLDLVVVSQGTNKMVVYTGTGDGHFKQGKEFAAGLLPTSVVVGDFGTNESNPRRDGRLDLAVTATGEGQIAVLFGDGAGNFGAPAKFAAPGATAITAADFNGDGVVDLATCNTAYNFIGVNLGYGSGTIGNFGGEGQVANFEPTTRPTTLAAGDFDGDGLWDLAVGAEFADGGGGVFILFNRPKPPLRLASFGSPILCATASTPGGIAVGKFSTDAGRPSEIAVADRITGQISLLRGEGKGGLASCRPAPQPRNDAPRTAAAAPP